MNFILFLYIIGLFCMFVQSAQTCTTPLAACFQALASAACFLQRVHVEKCSGKRFPEPKKCGAQRCGWSGPLLSAVVLLAAVGVMWCIDKTGPVQQPVCFCFVPSVGFWPLSSEDVRPTPGPHKIPVLTLLRFTFPQKVCFDTAYKYNKWFLKKCKF